MTSSVSHLALVNAAPDSVLLGHAVVGLSLAQAATRPDLSNSIESFQFDRERARPGEGDHHPPHGRGPDLRPLRLPPRRAGHGLEHRAVSERLGRFLFAVGVSWVLAGTGWVLGLFSERVLVATMVLAVPVQAACEAFRWAWARRS